MAFLAGKEGEKGGSRRSLNATWTQRKSQRRKRAGMGRSGSAKEGTKSPRAAAREERKEV